jgi:hypothetical protein
VKNQAVVLNAPAWSQTVATGTAEGPCEKDQIFLPKGNNLLAIFSQKD